MEKDEIINIGKDKDVDNTCSDAYDPKDKHNSVNNNSCRSR